MGGEPYGRGGGGGCSRVYPRVGGGTVDLPTTGMRTNGLSPRGRGNRRSRTDRSACDRSIPAWAGETGYSRTGQSNTAGLSPRGRGNPTRTRGPFPMWRSIPAWAGEPGGFSVLADAQRSIPAWAGEPICTDTGGCRKRVYPRVGGGTEIGQRSFLYRRGLSPRGRGNRRWRRTSRQVRRSIPAWAGEPRSVAFDTRSERVYPRVGGGNR